MLAVGLASSVGCVGSEQHPEVIGAMESSTCKRPEPGVDSDARCAGSVSACTLASDNLAFTGLTFPLPLNIRHKTGVARTSPLLDYI